MISPLRGRGRRHFLRVLVVVFVALLVVEVCAKRRASTVATFNIEEFPKSEVQVDGAFETIAELEADVIALQEITDPARLRREAHRRLGGRWRAAFPEEPPEMSPGVLVNTEHFQLVETTTHEQTVVYEGARPVFEAEMRRRGGANLEVFVVHFKAGSAGLPIRREQYDALQTILRKHRTDDRTTVLLGDFNSTELRDREMLADTAAHSPMRWISRRTECSGYWVSDESCRSFALDHVLAEGVAVRARSRGPCESVGCEPGDRCPIFHRRVSDHCPVTARVLLE